VSLTAPWNVLCARSHHLPLPLTAGKAPAKPRRRAAALLCGKEGGVAEK